MGMVDTSLMPFLKVTGVNVWQQAQSIYIHEQGQQLEV